MSRFHRLSIAVAFATLSACGGGYQGGDASVADGDDGVTIEGCDTIIYEGVQFDRVGCRDGAPVFEKRLQQGDVYVDLAVLCQDMCIDSVVVSGGSGPGAGDGGVPAATGVLGDPCEMDVDCAPGFFCDPETQVPMDVAGLPNGVPSVLSLLFPGGSCTPVPIGRYLIDDTCDPGAPLSLQGCGPDGACVYEPGFQDDLLACRRQCEPSADSSGCERKFYTCDFSVKACVEGCQSDEECRAAIVDADGDGIGDSFQFDDVSDAFCDEATRRCAHPGGSGVTGDPCTRIDDCEADGMCLTALQSFGGFEFPAGICTKRGCYTSGRECEGDGAICTTVRTWSGTETQLESCFTSCDVGADAPGDVTGTDGHGAGCRPGYRCHYNGGGAGEGICVGGEYNDVATLNVGEACETVDTCYSGYGLGRCITLGVGDVVAPSGVCTLMDCAAPGLPDDVCGEGNRCLLLSDDLTFCVQGCDAAADCAEGFACTDEDGDPATRKVCFPACVEDAECPEGQRCAIARGATLGQCVDI